MGRTLFGLESDRYDDLLRLLYWLRRPQVGEDIDPKKIAAMLGQSLPALPDDAVRQVGATLDDLSEFGERIARREAALAGLESFAEVYRGYARGVLADRPPGLVDRRCRAAAVRDQTRLEQWHTELTEQLQAAELAKREADSSAARNQAMLAELDRSPGANTRRELELLLAAVSRHQESATEAGERARSDTDRAERAAADVRRARDALAHTEAQVRARLDELVDAAAELSAPPLRVPRSSNWAGVPPEQTGSEVAAADTEWSAVIDACPPCDRLAAAATLLAEARERMTEAARVGDAAGVEERNAAAAEARAEQAQGRLADARTAAAAADDRYGTERDVWFADARGVALDLSAIASSTIDRDAVSGFPGRVREVAAGPEAELAADRASAAAAGAAARQLEATLRERRSRVAAVEDPVPPSPAWARDPRDGNSLALWRLVDLRVEIAPDHRAGLEAALEAAGLLDALVLPDGQLLHADTHDVVLRPAGVADGPTLSRYLQPDIPAGSPVQAATVASVLDSVAAGDSPVGDPVAWVGLDGSFRLGPLHGRGGKPAAQYLGASARAAERAPGCSSSTLRSTRPSPARSRQRGWPPRSPGSWPACGRGWQRRPRAASCWIPGCGSSTGPSLATRPAQTPARRRIARNAHGVVIRTPNGPPGKPPPGPV